MNKVHSIINEMEAESLISQGNYEEALKILMKSYENGSINKENTLNNIALCFLHFQEYEKARIYLEKMMELNPENSTALYNLAFSYYSLKNYQKAVEYFEKLKDKDNLSQDIAYHLGLSYLGLNQIVRAKECFDFLLEKNISPTLIYNIGITLIGMNYSEDARDYFIKYLSVANNDIDATFGLGIAYSRLEEYRKSIECFQRVVDWDNHRYISAYVSLAMAYFQIGDIKNAMQNIKTALDADSAMPEAWYYYGIIVESVGQIDKAISALRKAGELNHSMVEVWDRLGHLYLKQGQHEESRINYKKAYRLTKEVFYAHKLALILLSDKNFAGAIEYLLDCLNHPDYDLFLPVEIYENLATCYFNTGDFEKSAEFGRKTLDQEPSKPLLYFITGNSYMKLGKMKEARQLFMAGLELSKDDMNILYSLGILEGNLGDFKKAREYFNKALIIQRSPDIIYALALANMKLNENQAASQLFEEYQSFHMTEADVLYKLGLLFIELKSFKQAKKAFQDTLVLEPSNSKAKNYVNLLENK